MVWTTASAPIVYWVWVARRKGLSVRDVMGQFPHRGQLLIIVSTSIACFGLMLGCICILLRFASPEELAAPSSVQPLARLVAAVGVCTVGPIREEIWFRGILLPLMASRTGTIWAALLSTTLLSWLYANPFGRFALEQAMAGLYLRTGTLWAPAAAHGLYNAISLGVLTAYEQILRTTWLIVAIQIVCIPWLVLFLRQTLRDLRASEPCWS